MKKAFLYGALIIGICCHAQAANTTPNVAALRAGAQKGDAQSQLEYAKALSDQSHDEAALWMQKAADQGLAEAWFWLGYAGLAKEPPVFYYKKAAEMGYPEAYDYVLDELFFRADSSADIEEAKKFADLARKWNIKLYDAETKLKTIDRCYEAGSAAIPAYDQPTSEERNTFKSSKLNCWSFQQGIGTKQNWGSYRKCVLSQGDMNNNDLAEIYANGWGVKRNPKLALALACHGGSVPAELEAVVEALYTTKDDERLKNDFHFCNYVSSGLNGGFCAAKAEEMAAKKREIEFSALTSGWTEPQKNTFRALQNAANDFFSEHTSSEQDMSGTAREQIATAEEAALKDALLKNIEAFESGQLPKDTDFAKADKDLNMLYAQIMKKSQIIDYGTVTKDGIKATQRKWIKYRDAWIAFVAEKYPNHSTDSWKTWLTNERIEQLKEFAPTN